MRKINILITAATLLCCLLLPQRITAQSVLNGYASISYDENTNIITGVVTTELDFASQDWYQARVNGILYDEGGTLLGSGYANDVDRDGTVSVTMQAQRNSSLSFTAKGTNIALADVQDYSMGSGYYVDFHNFYEIRDVEGFYHLRLGTWWGMGPRKTTRTRTISLGSVIAQLNRVGYDTADMCSVRIGYTDQGKQSVTLDAANAGCTTQDPCDTSPGSEFTVTVNFSLPPGTTALSGTNQDNPGRTIVKSLTDPPSSNEFYIVGWRYRNVNLAPAKGSGEMVLTLHRRGRGEEITSNRLEIDIAADTEREGFHTESSLRVLCP